MKNVILIGNKRWNGLKNSQTIVLPRRRVVCVNAIGRKINFVGNFIVESTQ